METFNKIYALVFNIKVNKLIGFLPEVWIAPLNEDRSVSFVYQRVFINNIEEYGIRLDANLEKIFILINELQELNLEKIFNNSGSKKRNLSQLKEDGLLSPLIDKYVDKRINQFLNIITTLHYPITFNIDRTGIINSHLLNFKSTKPEIRLHFNKQSDGIYYKLNLQIESKRLNILNQNFVVVSNTFGWVIIARSLYKMEGINGNMLKPFIKKEEVFIPANLTQEYFKSFILRISNLENISSEGFEINHFQKITKVELELVEDFFNSSFFLKLEFYYQNEKFDYNSNQLAKEKIHFDNEDNINIHKYIRDLDSENKICLILENLGLSLSSNKHLVFSNSNKELNNLKEYITWLRTNRSILSNNNINIAPPYFFQKEINLEPYMETIRVNYEKDWFDILTIVRAGSMEFPFVRLAKYIKVNDNFYPLPDGTWFIIPDTWMTRYQTISKLGEEREDGIRLLNSHVTLLEDLDIPLKKITNKVKDLDFNSINVPDTLNAILRPYQSDGFRWLAYLYEQSLGACLADDMGLGKTLQAIALILYIQLNPKSQLQNSNDIQLDIFSIPKTREFCVLIVLPASLIYNWKQELIKFAPQLKVYNHVGSNRYQNWFLISKYDVVLTTYNIVVRDADILDKLTFNCIILDESQQIKNKDSKMFKAVNKLNSPFRLTLSGTPIENSLTDLWSQMQFINPGILGSFSSFKKNFKDDIEIKNDRYLLNELKKIVQPYILRRTKKAVAPDLPELTEQIHYCEMSEQQAMIYEKEKSAARNLLLLKFDQGIENTNFIVLNIIQRLRQIASHPGLIKEYHDIIGEKFDEVSYHFKTILKSGQKALIYSSYLQHLELYKSWLINQNINYSWFTGEQSLQERENAVQKFKQEDCPFFLLSLKAGGVGLNLTEASYVFLLDPWWNPAIENQAISRAHRIGQNQNVTAIRFITVNTIEEKIIQLQERKMKLADNIIEDSSYLNTLSNDDLLSLIE